MYRAASRTGDGADSRAGDGSDGYAELSTVVTAPEDQSANTGCCYRKARSRLYQIFKPDYFVVAVGAFSPSTGPTVEDFPTDTREATN